MPDARRGFLINGEQLPSRHSGGESRPELLPRVQPLISGTELTATRRTRSELERRRLTLASPCTVVIVTQRTPGSAESRGQQDAAGWAGGAGERPRPAAGVT